MLHGVMAWFNEERGDGLVRTDEGEAHPVAAASFVGGPPAGRCAGRPVTFRLDEEGRAVEVVLVEGDPPRRARMRSQRGASH